VPKQISGLQIIFLVRSFYRVHDTEKVSFELSALMELEYPGDANMGWFKDRFDTMLRHCRTKLEDKDKEGVLVAKLRKSDDLKPHLDYYDRLPDSHADKCFKWVSDLVDTLVENAGKRRNVDAMVSANATATAKKSGAPGKPKKDDVQSGTKSAALAVATGTTTQKSDKTGKGKGKGDQKDKKSKGKGKGNASNSGSDSETERKGQRGKVKKEIDPKHHCCIRHLWGLCLKPDTCTHGPHLKNRSPLSGSISSSSSCRGSSGHPLGRVIRPQPPPMRTRLAGPAAAATYRARLP